MDCSPSEEQTMRTFRDAKIMAKTLSSELAERRHLDLSHSECLEITARMFGHDSWNVLSAKTDELSRISGAGDVGPFSTGNLTVPVFRIFSVELAIAFTSTSSASSSTGAVTATARVPASSDRSHGTGPRCISARTATTPTPVRRSASGCEVSTLSTAH
jgi:hypothetical protein